MSSRYADNLGLPWSHVAEESTRFWLILCVVFALALPVALIIPGINLPEKERAQLEALPPQLAKVILEKKKVVKKPKEEVKKPEPEKKEIAEKKAEEKPPEVTKKPKPKIKKSPPQQTVEQAREVAQSSGLLALQDDLADMRESLDTAALSSAGAAVSNSMVAKTISAKANAVNSGKALAGSGGVNTADLGVPAETVVLSQRESTVLEENEAEKVTAQAKVRKKGKERGSDNIRRVFDQNKSSLFTLYNRELRKNPSLQGKVVLKITIEPNGSVSLCEIVSSDLDSPKLERKIASRVKLFNFGSMAVEVKTVNYPIEFFQS